MSISFAATPQSKEAQQARTYTDPSRGAPPSRRSGANAPYIDKDHWNKVFTEPEYFDSIAKQKGMAEGAKVSLFGDDYVYRQAMIGYMSATRGVPLDDMRKVFDVEKDAFAQKNLGKKTASAREMFDWHKAKYERENEKQAAARQILNNVAQRAMTDFATGGDTPFVESVANDIDAAGDMFTDEEKSRLWQMAEENDIKLRATQMRFAPEAKFIFDALRQTTGEGAGFGAPDMRDMATRFAKLPDKQRRAVYELAGSFAQLNQTDKGFWYQMAESLGRGASDIVERVPRNVKEQALRNDLRLLEGDQPVFAGTGVQGTAYSAFGTTPLTPEEREQAAEKVRGELGIFKVERELRDLAERVIDPIKTVTVLPEIVEEGLYGAARSLPYTAVAAVPYAGAPAVAGALYSSNYDRIMLEYPDIDPDKAALIAAISAPIEAGLERMKVNTIMGRLPFFGGLVKRFQHPNQRNITRIAIGGAGVLAEQNAQEILQNATFPFVQMIGSALDKDIPEYNLDLASMPRDLAVQFVALLPLSLMGVGALSYREISRGEQYLRSKDNLEKAGYSEEQIDRITGAATADEAQSILREESKKRDPEKVKAAAQRIVDESIALREKVNPAALPRLEKQGADYVVLSPEGKELARSTDQTAAEQALVSARRETVQREMRDVHTGINEAVEFIKKVNEARQRGEDIAAVIRDEAPRTLLTDYEANPTQENLDRLFETVRAFGQDINEPAELANFPVTGSNQGALREGIWRSIIRINEGADGTIVMREFAQDNLKRAIAEGRVTMDFVRQQLNDILPQIDSDRMERRLRTETDTDVIEAFSDIAVAYFRGSIREEQIPAGLRGIMRRLAIMTRDIFRRAYNLARLRAEGKLDRDFEALLAEAVGVNQQALVDRARERTEQEVGAGNYSLQPVSFNSSTDIVPSFSQDLELAAQIKDAKGRSVLATDKQVAKMSDEKLLIAYGGASMAFQNGGDSPLLRVNVARWHNELVKRRLIEPVPAIASYLQATNNYSIVRSVDHFKNDTRFDKLVKDGRVFIGVDVNDFIDQHILLHSPDNAFAGTIQLTDGEQIDGKGGVYYPVLYADKNYFWASTAAMVMRTATHLNEIAAKNGGRVLMGLVSAPVEKLFSSTSMSTGVVKFLNALTNDPRAGLSKADLNAMLVAASKVEVVVQTKTKTTKKTFSTKLKASDSYAKNFAKIDTLLAPDGSIFQVRKAFVESLADQVSKHLNATPATAEYVAGILADAENKHAKNAIKRGKLSKASFLQGLGNMLTEPFLRDFQEHGNGKIYAIVEVQGEVKGIATTEHESYPATIVPVNKKSKVKLHVLKEAVDWQDVVGKETGQYATPQERLNLLPTSGVSSTNLKVLGVKAGSSTAPINYSIGNQRDIINDAIVRLGGESATMTSNTAWMTPSAKFLNVGAHGHADILGDKFQISVVDYMNLGFVRLNARESGKLYADGFRLTPRQVAELKSTAIEKQLELVIERGTQDQQNYSIGVPTKKQRLDLTRYSEEDAINIIMFLDALAQRQTNQGINEQWFIRAYRALPQTFKDAIAYDGEDTLFRGTDPDFNYQEFAEKGYGSQMTMTFTSQESYARWFGSNVISTDPAVLEAAGVPAFTDSIDTGKVREMYERRANKNMLFDHIGHDIEVGDDEGEVIMLIDDGRTLDDAEAMSFYDEDLQDLRERHEREGIIEKIRTSNYSISTQSEIDRVSAAMGALDRSPLDTLEITEKLRKRFASIMAENMVELAAMRQGGVAEREVLDEEGNPIGPQPTGATTKATGAEIRRTKLLQALGELDGLLSALPPQVAAKVGGYTVLANIGTGDRALSNFFIKRLEMINKELERYLKDRYTKALDQLFQRAKPRQDAAGKVPQGKLGASVHALFDQLKLATKKTVVEVDGEVTSLEQQVASGELEAEEEAMKGLLADVLPLFANWETADASRMAQAVQIGFDILRKAYKRQRELTQIKRNQQEERRLVARESTGITGDIDEAINKKQNIAGKRWQQWKALNVNLFGFDQLISFVFGRDSKITKEIVNAQRKADNVKADELIGVWEEWQGVLAELAGVEDSRSMKATHKGQDIVYRLAEPKTAKIKHTNMQGEEIELEFSQNQLITITMMWMQPKGRAHMMGKLDSDGNPIGDWHYDQDFVNRVEAKMTPEARAIRRFLLRKYAEEWSSINEVFVRLRGINMPQEDFYSPLGVDPVVAIDSGLLADPSTGFALSAPNRTPPALRSRGAAVAKPKFQDAVQVYFAHRKQMAHWKAYAEFNSDMLSVLGHRNTRNAVEAKGGVEALKTLNKWLTYMTQGGNIDAAAGLAMNEYFNGVMGRIASFILFGKVVTIAIQSTQLGAAAAKMPFPSYIKRLAKLLTGQMSWGTSLRSPYIQRRIKEMPPQVQLAMEGLLANKPSYVAEAARRVGWYISGSDGLYTAGTYAMIYDYRLEQAKKAGLSGPEAERVAREEAERDTDEVAQPTRMGARSAFEATMTSPLARSAWAFGSDARKNWAMNSFLWFSNASADRKRQALYFTAAISTAMATVIRIIARDIKDDDDDELFDEKNWDVRRMVLMMATDFVYGFPVLGEMAEETAFRLFGEYRPQGSVLSVGDAPAALSRMPQHIADTLNGEADTDKIVKDVNRMLQGMGLFAPQAASAAALSNAAKDLYEFTKPLWKDDE